MVCTCPCRLASKTDMLERLYDCLTALQQQYEINREDGLYWQQTAQTTATQLAMTGEASTALLAECLQAYPPLTVQCDQCTTTGLGAMLSCAAFQGGESNRAFQSGECSVMETRGLVGVMARQVDTQDHLVVYVKADRQWMS